MPTVLRLGPYRFCFHAGDRDEPPHIHFEREDHIRKFWLDAGRIQNRGGFTRQEINSIERLVEEKKYRILNLIDTGAHLEGDTGAESCFPRTLRTLGGAMERRAV